MLVSSSNFSASTFPPTLLLTPIISIHSSKDVIIVVKWFSCSIIFYDNLFAVHFITLVSSERSIVYDFIFTSSFPILFHSSCCFLNISSYQVNMAWIFQCNILKKIGGGVVIVGSSLYIVVLSLDPYCVYVDGYIVRNIVVLVL